MKEILNLYCMAYAKTGLQLFRKGLVYVFNSIFRRPQKPWSYKLKK